MSYHISVFISHSWSYSDHYDTLREWIFGDSWNSNGTPINFYDQSVPKDNPIHNAPDAEALRRAIWAQIAKSQVIVIPTGMYANYSIWIKKEIEGARHYARPVLAVDPWGQKKSSSVVMGAASEDVGWTKQSVVNGIWKLYGS